jgi:CheY-like chemotaxis protein
VAHRILVGDDNEQMRRLIVELLEAEGHEVAQASDTCQVLEQAS